MWCHVRSSIIKTFIWSYKLLRCETKVYTPRKRDGERFYTVNFYLGKWFWSIQYRFAGNAYLSIVVYSIFGFSRWQRSATSELLWYIQSLEAAAPSWLALSLLSGAEKKLWRISHFCDWVNRQPLRLLAFTTLRPLRAFRPNFTNY